MIQNNAFDQFIWGNEPFCLHFSRKHINEDVKQ